MRSGLTALALATGLVATPGLGGSPAEQALEPRALIKVVEEAKGEGLPGYTATVELVSVDGTVTRRQTMALKVGRVEKRSNNSLVEFLEPPNARGQKVLMVQRNMWFLRPGLGKAVPISPRQRLVGEASVGDVASTNYVDDYTATLARDEPCGSELCRVLELKAASPKATYDRVLYWVVLARLVAIKAEFFTVSGRRLKYSEFTYDNSVRFEGRTRAFLSEMVIHDDLDAARSTTMKFSGVKVAHFGASDFDLNLLTR